MDKKSINKEEIKPSSFLSKVKRVLEELGTGAAYALKR
tara:strand:+ start:1349 stop:1462 length:114 start_codon:yes stop_codon:yes gene_type:complete